MRRGAIPPISTKHAMTLYRSLGIALGIIASTTNLCFAFHTEGDADRARHVVATMPRLRDVVVPTALAIGIMFGNPIHTMSAPIDMTFANGSVRLDDPLRSFPGLELGHPRYLGSGGGGAVFACDRIDPGRPTLARTRASTDTDTGADTDAQSRKAADVELVDKDAVVVKVSWSRSAASVEKECAVLKYMETNHVPGVERCRGQVPYPLDNRRLMIAMEPVVDDSVASISEIDERLRPTAVRCIIRTLVQMLSCAVVTTDVQPLISKVTGEVLFIDMTEAKVVFTDNNDGRKISFVDQALASSFVSEMLGLILAADSSDELIGVANEQLTHELQIIGEEIASGRTVDNREGVIRQQQQQLLLQLLRDQATFMSQDGIDCIDGLLHELSPK